MWIEVLVDPGGQTRFLEESDPRYGVALLLQGRFRDYESIRGSTGWPGLGEDIQALQHARESDASFTLLSALCGHLSGNGSATEMYFALSSAKDTSEDLRVAAAVLGGIAAADAGSPSAAASRLNEVLGHTGDPVRRMLLSIHAGVRAAEAGDMDAAIEATDRAIAERPSESTRSSQQREMYSAIARHNRWHFSALANLGSALRTRRLPRRSRFESLNEIDLLLADALSSYLEDQFRVALSDPYARTLSWRAEDPIDRPFVGALLRAECLADWDSLRRARRLVGRYQLLSDVAAETTRSTGFQLLRRAGDRKAMEQAARLFSRVGPLEGLRDSTTAVVGQAWPPLEQSAVLALIREGADLLTEEVAAQTLRRILADRLLITRHAAEALPALARLERVAGPTAREELAEELFKLTDTKNPLVLHSMQSVVRSLDWSAVTEGARARWLGYLQAHLGDGTDAQFLAAGLALGLSTAGIEDVEPLLEEAFSRRPSLDIAGMLIDGVGDLRESTRALAVQMAADSLIAEQTDAAAGRFGFGTVNVSALLAALLSGADEEPWRVLTDYLLDPNVAGEGKASALNRLSASGASLPPEPLSRLRKGVPDLSAYSEPWISPPHSLAGSVLRFGLHINAFDEAEALARLLDLVGDRSVEARLEGVRTIQFASRGLSAGTVATLALALIGDDDHNVRAEAGRETAALRVDSEPAVTKVIVDRLSRLLTERGVVVPLGVLVGLRHARPSPAIGKLFETASSVGLQHLSARVRQAAARVSHGADTGT